MNSSPFDLFRAALVTAYADLFANDADYAYSASKCTPDEMAGKMLAAALKGSADYSGKGFRRACSALGVKPTGKAIREYLGVIEAAPVAKAPTKARPRLVDVIGLSNIEAAMSGVSRIHRAHDLVTLHYTNGATESGKILEDRWTEIHDKPFSIVSEVQAQRVPANA